MTEHDKQMADQHLEALMRERAGYQRAGRADRVAEVDKAIAAAGGVPPVPAPSKRTAGKK